MSSGGTGREGNKYSLRKKKEQNLGQKMGREER